MEVNYSREFLETNILIVDIETKDPDLTTKGPSTFRGGGHIIGVALATESGLAEYYNIGHIDCSPELKERNLHFLKQALERNNIKVGAKIAYDFEWIELALDIKMNGKLYDIQIAENLIDENKRFYNLDSLAHKYLDRGKFKDEIQSWCDYHNLKGAPAGHLWRMPYDVVRNYALQDVLEPLEIIKMQLKILEEQNLMDLFHLECDLIRVLTKMRKNGVRIDVKQRNRNALMLQNNIEENQIIMRKDYGDINVKSSKQIAEILDRLNIDYPVTDKGNASINALYLKSNLDIPFLKLVYEIRRARTISGSFLMGSLVDYLTDDGLIHCQFFNTKTDDFGTKSGRFSSANPNLQQIPSKGVDEYYGQLCREVFVPIENQFWVKLDYSQIEYRFMAHFAVGPGSEEVRAAYNSASNMDYHQYIMDLTGLKRRFAKNLNFGVAYGMGPGGMANLFNWEKQYCYDILRVYHKSAPFIKSTIKAVEEAAVRRGYVKTFLNRRARLVDRNKVYTMFCRLNQGSAADLMKKSMVDIYKAGLMDVLTFHLTVHDELDLSLPKTKIGLEALKETKYIMENCVKLDVPVKTDVEIGNNWADIDEVDLNNFDINTFKPTVKETASKSDLGLVRS